MAESNYTYGCGKFLPGYGPGNQLDFVPPGSVGTPDPPPQPDPTFVCMLTGIDFFDSGYVIDLPEQLTATRTWSWTSTTTCVEQYSHEWVTGVFDYGLPALVQFSGIWKVLTGPAGTGTDVDFQQVGLPSFDQGCPVGGCPTITLVLTDTVKVAQPTKMTVTCQAPPEEIVEDVPLLFDYVLTAANKANKIEVYYGDGFSDTIPIPIGATEVTKSHIYADPGNYTLTATALLGTTEIDTFLYNFDVVETPTPDVTISINEPLDLVVDKNLDFEFIPSDPQSIDEIVVQYGDGKSATLTVGPIYTDTTLYDTTGTYTITATGYLNGVQVATTSKDLTIGTNPTVIFITALPAGFNYALGTEVTFTATIDPPAGTGILWGVDDNYSLGSTEFIYTFQTPGTYKISCISGAIAYAEVFVTISLTGPGGN